MAVTVPQARKAVVASVGAAVVILANVAGVTVADSVDDTAIGVFDAVVAFLAAVGVFNVPNEPQVGPPA